MFAFLALTFAWSWSFDFLASRLVGVPVLSAGLSMIAIFGPSLAATLIVYTYGGKTGLQKWFHRCLNWNVGWYWYALAFFAPFVVIVTAWSLHVALGGEMPEITALQHIPLAIANFGLVLLVGGPLGEEFGWRGYLTPALAARLDWRAASLVVGVIWGVWHMPLFFSADTVQSRMPLPVYFVNILAGSVCFGGCPIERGPASFLRSCSTPLSILGLDF